jgi:hypothetical protein
LKEQEMPRISKQNATEDTGDFVIDDASGDGESDVIDMMSSNVATRLALGEEISVVAAFKGENERLKYEKFMEEPVIIEIHETSDKNAPDLVFVGVNGDQRWLPRGRPIRLQRKFVEVLAQRHERTYKTVENKERDSANGMIVKGKNAQPYPFSVIRDESPGGREWLKRTIRQGS